MAASDSGAAAGDASPQTGGRVQLERIYLKDLSFESPRAPDVFRLEWRPAVQLDINTQATPLAQNRFEVVLTATLRATLQTPAAPAGDAGNAAAEPAASAAAGRDEEQAAIIIEVQQAGAFRIENVDDNSLRHILAVACPDILFPYVRETVDSLAARGTFPPFMLTPVDFAALYAEAMRQREAQARLN